MLDHNRLALAIEIQSQSYKLLRWLGGAVEKGWIPIARAEQHSDSPDAAFDWLESNRFHLPANVRPEAAHLREFANFFWTYVTTSFDVIASPGTRLLPGSCGCLCPLCARIASAPHLQPKKLTKADKIRAGELMVNRAAVLAREEGLNASPDQVASIVGDADMRRPAAFSTYGQWLINRLSGLTDGPSILALWREIAWTKAGSPIQGFALKLGDFIEAEQALIAALGATH